MPAVVVIQHATNRHSNVGVPIDGSADRVVTFWVQLPLAELQLRIVVAQQTRPGALLRVLITRQQKNTPSEIAKITIHIRTNVKRKPQKRRSKYATHTNRTHEAIRHPFAEASAAHEFTFILS